MSRRRFAARLQACVLALALVAPPALAVGRPDEMLPDPAQEERARAIGRELRCLVCQNQSIEDSEADLARQLRVLVREQLASGASDTEAVRFVHDRYGDFVLLRPPVTGATLLLWGAPALALLLGLGMVWTLRRRAAVPEPASTPLSEAELARLARMERGETP